MLIKDTTLLTIRNSKESLEVVTYKEKRAGTFPCSLSLNEKKSTVNTIPIFDMIYNLLITNPLVVIPYFIRKHAGSLPTTKSAGQVSTESDAQGCLTSLQW